MIDLYFWPTANGLKVPILLKELGLEFTPHLINIRSGANQAEDFLRINPHARIPAIVDSAPPGAGPALTIYESGAILIYLADKYQRFLPVEPQPRYQVLQWVFWQVGHAAASLGLYQSLKEKITEPVPASVQAIAEGETVRLYQALEQQLSGREYVAGAYSIADIAIYPWIQPLRQGRDIAAYPNIARWSALVAARPAVQQAYRDGLAATPNEKSLAIALPPSV